jgi:DNA-binding beta-propeller fold protein YncE
LSPDGSQPFVVNTPDNTLEIFDVGVGGLTFSTSVSVGTEPVAVAARTNDEVWVVNHGVGLLLAMWLSLRRRHAL